MAKVQRSRREFLRLAAIGATGTAISLLAAPAAIAAPVSVPAGNTLYVGNLPMAASEEELRALFADCPGYKRLSFKTKPNGPMCFVEFEDVVRLVRFENCLWF